jgi:hypothetical protein
VTQPPFAVAAHDAGTMIESHPDICRIISRQHQRDLLAEAARVQSARPPRRTLVALATAALRGLRPAARVVALRPRASSS